MCIRDRYYIDRLSGYIASTGRKYKNHAATIRSWAADDTAKAVSYTHLNDIKTLYDKFKGLSLKDKTTEETAGADVTSFRFNLSDGTSSVSYTHLFPAGYCQPGFPAPDKQGLPAG